MKDLIIIGAGGFAREVAWLTEAINKKKKKWNLLGFVDDNTELIGKSLNGYKVLGTLDYLKEVKDDVYLVIAIGSSSIRKDIANRISKKNYAILIHPEINMSKFNDIGEGTIICKDTILTVNIKVGKHVIINLDCTIGHDCVIEDYVTIFPSANISGQTLIREGTEIGTSCFILQGVKIGEQVKLGAGAVVIKDIEGNCVAVGNPAKKIKDKRVHI